MATPVDMTASEIEKHQKRYTEQMRKMVDDAINAAFPVTIMNAQGNAQFNLTHEMVEQMLKAGVIPPASMSPLQTSVLPNSVPSQVSGADILAAQRALADREIKKHKEQHEISSPHASCVMVLEAAKLCHPPYIYPISSVSTAHLYMMFVGIVAEGLDELLEHDTTERGLIRGGLDDTLVMAFNRVDPGLDIIAIVSKQLGKALERIGGIPPIDHSAYTHWVNVLRHRDSNGLHVLSLGAAMHETWGADAHKVFRSVDRNTGNMFRIARTLKSQKYTGHREDFIEQESFSEKNSFNNIISNSPGQFSNLPGQLLGFSALQGGYEAASASERHAIDLTVREAAQRGHGCARQVKVTRDPSRSTLRVVLLYDTAFNPEGHTSFSREFPDETLRPMGHVKGAWS